MAKSELNALLKRYQELSPVLSDYKKTIFIDLTITHKWLKEGVMIGIVRVCNELFIALRKIAPVEMVAVVTTNGRPEIKKIDLSTLEIEDKVIIPKKGDILLTPELQIRGVHVPMNHPEIACFENIGLKRYAVIHDILPINHPEYFEDDTAKGMPAYLMNCFRNYERIICVSKAVGDTIIEYIKNGQIEPFDLEIDFQNPCNPYRYLTTGWYNIEDGYIWTTNRAVLSFYVCNISSSLNLHIRFRSFPDVGATTIKINGNEIGCVSEKGEITNVILYIDKKFLNQGGVQVIEIVTDGAYSFGSREAYGDTRVLGIAIQYIRIQSEDRDCIPVYKLIRKPLKLGYAYSGVTEFRQDNSGIPDHRIIDFLKKERNINVFLMVGTIEPRKGYEIILRVFEKLWREGFEGKLCLIGRTGWKMKEFVRIIETHIEFGKKLLFLEAASDATLGYAYSHSDALIQASADEGFGLPLIEAGQHGIPVLCSDIPVFHEVGGSHVLYFDRENDEDIIRCISEFCLKQKEGTIPDSKKISSISWSDCANTYMEFFEGKRKWLYDIRPEEYIKKLPVTGRKKIVVTITFSIFPPQNGGQARVFGLYKNLAKNYDIEIIALGAASEFARKQTIAPGLTEIVIPKSLEHEQKEMELSARTGIPITDIGMMLYHKLTPGYMEAVQKSALDAEYIIVCHPYTYEIVKKTCPNKKIAYEAQDVEYLIKKEMLKDNEYNAEILQQLYDLEKQCCIDSKFIMTCSESDKKTLAQLYEVSTDKILTVPNGVDCEEIKFINVEKRKANKERLNIMDKTIGVFMGSWHKPNLDAAEKIINIAPQCPNTIFLLMGSQCAYFKNYNLPTNVGLLGLISEEEMDRVFSAVDFALNPMESGSGTNLKMFDYMARGLPIITTEFGTRGIKNKELFLVSDVEHMVEIINGFNLDECSIRIDEARKYVVEAFDWSIISRKVLEKLITID